MTQNQFRVPNSICSPSVYCVPGPNEAEREWEKGNWKGLERKKGSISQLQRDQANNRKRWLLFFLAVSIRKTLLNVESDIFFRCFVILAPRAKKNDVKMYRLSLVLDSIFIVCQRHINEFVLGHLIFSLYNHAENAKCQRETNVWNGC